MGFEKTYRKRIVWGSHGKPTRINQIILVEIDREKKKWVRLFEEVAFPLPEKCVMPKKPKRKKLAKWGRNKPK